MNITVITAVGGFVLALLIALSGFIVWFANSEKRKYGLERDFNHLKRNQEQIQQGIETLLREVDRRFDSIERDILEVKAEFRVSVSHDLKQ